MLPTGGEGAAHPTVGGGYAPYRGGAMLPTGWGRGVYAPHRGRGAAHPTVGGGYASYRGGGLCSLQGGGLCSLQGGGGAMLPTEGATNPTGGGYAPHRACGLCPLQGGYPRTQYNLHQEEVEPVDEYTPLEPRDFTLEELKEFNGDGDKPVLLHKGSY